MSSGGAESSAVKRVDAKVKVAMHDLQQAKKEAKVAEKKLKVAKAEKRKLASAAGAKKPKAKKAKKPKAKKAKTAH